MIWTSQAHAAERVRYEDLASRLAPFGSVLDHRSFKVTTLDGKQHSARMLRLDPDHVRIFGPGGSWEDIPSAEIARIEIRQSWRFSHHIEDNAFDPIALAAFACSGLGEGDNLVMPLLCAVPVAPVSLAYAAVTAPFYLAADAIFSLAPPKTYEILQN